VARRINRWTCGLVGTAACLAAAGTLAQGDKTIVIRMLDSKTGNLIATSDFLVQVDHQAEQHANWVRENQDGAGEMTVPGDATLILIHAKYDAGINLYVNCDAEQDRGSADRDEKLHHWYTISEILATGVVAPNGCGSAKQAMRFKVTARPGEFVFFVRKRNWKEEATD
jgi:hypothetical protein